MRIQTHYLHDVFDIERFHYTVEKAKRAIELWGKEFDSIAFSGLSGAALAFPLSYLMNKELIAVRKYNDDTHSCWQVEGSILSKTYIIVDDCMETGTTINRIIHSIKKTTRWPTPVGIYLYNGKVHSNKIPPMDIIQ